MTGQEFRILSLDGGGIRGTYAAAVLSAIERTTGKSIVRHFDLITGTSTGGIIALALGLGVPAADVLGFYTQHGPSIFPATRWPDRLLRFLRQLVAPKYGTGGLKAALSTVFKDHLLGHSSCRLVIPAYDVVSNNVHVFKTAHQERFRTDFKRPAVEVALATAAAPTYFPRSVTASGEQLVDGGIWANCPAMVGIADALDIGIPLASIRMLSIGTLTESRAFAARARSGGILGYRRGLINLMLDAQARGALAQAKLLLKDRLYRIDQTVPEDRYALDDARALNDLISHGEHSGRHHAEAVLTRLLCDTVKPFEPLHIAHPALLSSTSERAG